MKNANELVWENWLNKRLNKNSELAWGSIQKAFRKEFPASPEFKKFVWDNYEIIPDKKSEKSRVKIKNSESIQLKEDFSKFETIPQTSNFKCIWSKDFLNLLDVSTNRVINVVAGHPHFQFLTELFESKDYDTMFELADPLTFVMKNLTDFVTKIENKFYLTSNDTKYEIPDFLNLIKDLCSDLSSYKNLDYFKLFIIKLLKNESTHELPYFLEYLASQKFIINEDGNIIGYKAVQKSLLDKHSSTIRNDVGATITMARDKVTQNRNEPCSAGLHVGNLRYIEGYWSKGSDTLLAVEIQPEDLVSVPGKNEGKIRVCRYKVLCKIDYDFALRKNKFLSTQEFIETFSLKEKEVQKISSSESSWQQWVDLKLNKLQEITWGGLKRSFKKVFSESLIPDLKKFLESNYLIQREKKSESSRIRKK